MYYIKVKWQNSEMYYAGQRNWVKKDSPFYHPKRYNLIEANKRVLRMMDNDRTHEYTLEEVR